MDGRSDARMWANLAKGVMLLLGGLAAVLAIEVLWDGAAADSDSGGWDGAPWNDGQAAAGALAAYALDGDAAGLGIVEAAPPLFLAECLDPREAGEARASEGGDVVQVVSPLSRYELFALCRDALGQRGWMQMDGGDGSRATFMKGSGCYRWLFLDVTTVADASSAVFYLRGVGL